MNYGGNKYWQDLSRRDDEYWRDFRRTWRLFDAAIWTLALAVFGGGIFVVWHTLQLSKEINALILGR